MNIKLGKMNSDFIVFLLGVLIGMIAEWLYKSIENEL